MTCMSFALCSSFLLAGALPATQPTASKHWRHRNMFPYALKGWEGGGGPHFISNRCLNCLRIQHRGPLHIWTMDVPFSCPRWCHCPSVPRQSWAAVPWHQANNTTVQLKTLHMWISWPWYCKGYYYEYLQCAPFVKSGLVSDSLYKWISQNPHFHGNRWKSKQNGHSKHYA